MEFTQLLKVMIERGASDLFVSAGARPSIKVDGTVKPLTKEPLKPSQARSLVYSTMNDKQIAEYESTHECNFAISAPGLGRFRVSAYVQRNTPGMVLRRINTHIPNFEELNLPPVMKDLAMTKRGLILFVGGTSTGKSTSLASMIDYRNRHSRGHIITIEDPIEYIHEHKESIVTQREVGIDTDSFEIALRNTLRQAPDVILMGEIRTRELMKYGLSFAETGHLCMATLHANNANQALDRIISFFPPEHHDQVWMELSLNLKAIVAQQLLPTKDGKGRRAAIEVMICTPLIQDMIRKGEVHEIKEIMKKSTNLGMQTFDQALYELYREGTINYDTALAHADSANDLRLMIKLNADTNPELNAAAATENDSLFLQEDEDYMNMSGDLEIRNL
ncbi:PilT/PilU family type 4a pilus ATPase [Neptunomonas phycophila]|uniref:PilT/PilU family type 4a pilus ATPase n=2 Tax=Neptunomonas phycophila TaxID=1572645 RepID=A0AAW7XLA6_9GAMM|nr:MULTISPECIES: PilT/PilU family type 4a pilus ATPase [Neptunomonas]MDN2660772.1 PilT/PilU family type 4a pilus ATPase [Neptunomonas sp. CHC150]MDO6453713.1 PilT/PilU family type 4a pilus ATPase [Neptunomonas phycophila]MDO6467977.1 PilT/PilU family type 4a pilus ATPase [Neptunomonas phycophila]MDP2523359.1 PilT/PilU family type 4a pilus ATPase [Neptunomonas phycophila]QLE96464.1 PilT/PilU family type 4a pilus ATPase [Neptunomonas phycophila]